MGVICPLSPETRAINKKNHQLEKIIKEHIEELGHYGFSSGIIDAINSMPTRYMYHEGILQDIEKLHTRSRLSYSSRADDSSLFLQDDLKNSCLIIENQAQQANNEEREPPSQSPDSFVNNLKKNQSLVVQINILYKQQIKVTEYSSSLNLFLKWANMFQEHTYGGFLKPMYRHFYQDLSTIPESDMATIVDEICVFVQFMVSVVTDIYGLRIIAESQNGKLIKNQNVYNLIMTFLFKRTKIRPFLLRCIKSNYYENIQSLEKQLKRICKKPIQFFGVSPQFTLQDEDVIQNNAKEGSDDSLQIEPYSESLKLVTQLSKSSSPITKLKTVVAISKQICKQINKYYERQQKVSPELDPDNLSSIVMYLLARTGNPGIYEQLKIVQSFTTTNCLNCISGFYLNVFMATLESIIALQS